MWNPSIIRERIVSFPPFEPECVLDTCIENSHKKTPEVRITCLSLFFKIVWSTSRAAPQSPFLLMHRRIYTGTGLRLHSTLPVLAKVTISKQPFQPSQPLAGESLLTRGRKIPQRTHCQSCSSKAQAGTGSSSNSEHKEMWPWRLASGAMILRNHNAHGCPYPILSSESSKEE